MGELRRGVALIRHRGNVSQADRLERWLGSMLDEFYILPVDADIAQVWGRLRVRRPERARQIHCRNSTDS